MPEAGRMWAVKSPEGGIFWSTVDLMSRYGAWPKLIGKRDIREKSLEEMIQHYEGQGYRCVPVEVRELLEETSTDD